MDWDYLDQILAEDEAKRIDEQEEEPFPDNAEKAIIDDIGIENFYSDIPSMAKTFAFELDPFQKRGILRMEQGQHIMAVAHTSAGKTVFAEYAIAASKRNETKVIYTSPLKALSNQKYRDFKAEFGDVGIMTGDISLHNEAQCLVMTTEVLRGMLYNRSPILGTVEWVVLDEVHYINDEERGVVWEEVIMMLAKNVKIIMLSATVPNYLEFANWVAYTRKQFVYVQFTEFRPVPLEHSAYINENFIQLIDERGKEKWQKYGEEVHRHKARDAERGGKGKKGGKGGKKGKNENKIPSMADSYAILVEQFAKCNRLPSIIFSFSRNGCDEKAEKLSERVKNLVTPEESKQIRNFAQVSLLKLEESERELPQVAFVVKLATFGIGVHHSGILPLLKEIVEILFTDGLIKVLFATETVAVGLNMPTKTAVFSDLQKFDGTQRRYITPSEYTQMSGRAGRRGKDDLGHIVIFIPPSLKAIPFQKQLQKFVTTKPLDLESKFKLTYRMIASHRRQEGTDTADILKSSFAQKDALLSAEEIESKIEELQNTLNETPTQDFIDLFEAHDKLLRINKTLGLTKIGLKMSQPKLMLMSNEKQICRTFLAMKPLKGNNIQGIDIFTSGRETRFNKATFSIENLVAVYDLTIPKRQLNVFEDRRSMMEAKYLSEDLLEQGEFAGFRALGSVYDVEEPSERAEVVKQILESKVRLSQKRHRSWQVWKQDASVKEELEHYMSLLTGDKYTMMEEYDNRVNLLSQLGYLEDKKLTLKGRVIQALSNPHDIVISEAFFRGIFQPLPVEELAAIASAFVKAGKTGLPVDKKNVTDNICQAAADIEVIIDEVMEQEKEIGLEQPLQELSLNNCSLVYKWACGATFIELLKITDEKEGNLVRIMLMTAELLHSLHECAQMIEDEELMKKCEAAAGQIKRSIVFPKSLYLE